ncbi:chorismate mutase [Magnetospirillum molischianum]|uniref:chorismate mutase n=1 Tax=Magnetospirillum molischianum DSM 120 TaxID=1150626 RepID=H8FW52_MAGML|nr:chorismate mutase [Magnetospirillum molischianum]CCG42590.1 Chorismate mutase [Magnetospirillum molischianum DSM 120]
MTQDSTSLDSLRREIDSIDESIHDLLIQRSALVERIANAKGETITVLRPGREAEILRRLLARHRGQFPRMALVRIWREMIGALLAIQAPFAVAVQSSGRGPDFIELARNHFGVVVPLQACRTAGQVVRAVADSEASAGLVSMPAGIEMADEPEPWWASLAVGSGEAPRVVARLPFVSPPLSSGVAELPQALVIACRDHDDTGDDRTLVVLETGPDVSRDRLRAAMAAGGLESAGLLAICRRGDAWLHLIEIQGHVAVGDPRLARLAAQREPVAHVSVIGGYATPLPPESIP